jgi:hypothetical protein
LCGVERASGNDGRDSLMCVGKGREMESEREEQ